MSGGGMMHFLKIAGGLAVCLLGAARAAGQMVPLPGATVEASGYDARGSSIPANSTSTLLNLTVEGETTGESIFDMLTPAGKIASASAPW
jgi:hypothetical protein